MKKFLRSSALLIAACLSISLLSGSTYKNTAGQPVLRTLVSAKAFAYSQSDKTHKMSDMALLTETTTSVNSIQSSADTENGLDYIKLTVNGNTIHAEGINNEVSGIYVYNETLGLTGTSPYPVTNDKYSIDLPLSPSIEGTYIFRFCSSKVVNDKPNPLYSVAIDYKSGAFSIPLSSVYSNNVNKIGHTDVSYNTLGNLTYDQVKTLTSLSDQICTGVSGDYNKLVAIHNWETKNIYYDEDAINNNTYDADGYKTLSLKRGVCSGISHLYEMLCEAQGLQAYFIVGYGADDADEFPSGADSNHAWNLANVGGRLMNIDATWDSFNIYENGKSESGNQRTTYFDISNEFFAQDHRIDDIYKDKFIVPTFDKPTYSTKKITNGNVTVKVNVADSLQPTLSHTFTANGTYKFTAADKFGSKNNHTVTVDNIDKTPPTFGSPSYSTKKATNRTVTVTIPVLGGSAASLNHTFTQNGSYAFTAKDKAGNKATYKVTVKNIDTTPPALGTPLYSTTRRTSKNVTVTIPVSGGIVSKLTHTFTKNGSFIFTTKDKAGNIASCSVSVDNINKSRQR